MALGSLFEPPTEEGGGLSEFLGGVDPKALIVTLALSQIPELSPAIPLFVQGFKNQAQRKEAQRFALGMSEAVQLAAMGDTEGALKSLHKNVRTVTPSTVHAFATFAQQLVAQRQQQLGGQQVQQAIDQIVSAPEGERGEVARKTLAPLLGQPGIQQSALVGALNVLFPEQKTDIVPGSGQVVQVDPRFGGIRVGRFQPALGAEAISTPARLGLNQLGVDESEVRMLLNSQNTAERQKGAAILQLAEATASRTGISRDIGKLQQEEAIKQATQLSTARQMTPILVDRKQQEEQVQLQYRIRQEMGLSPLREEDARKQAVARALGTALGEDVAFNEFPLKEKSRGYINAETLVPVKGTTTGKELLNGIAAGNVVAMSESLQQEVRQTIQAGQTYQGVMTKLRSIVEQNPDLFPATGTLAENAAKQLQLWLAGKTKGMDPRFVKAFGELDALRGTLAKAVKFWGDSGILSKQDIEFQQDALGLEPMLREGSLARLATLEQLAFQPVNDYLRSLGLKKQFSITAPDVPQKTMDLQDVSRWLEERRRRRAGAAQ